MFRSCQIIIRELCSLLKLCYSFHNSVRICKRGVVAACHVVWECAVEQWLATILGTSHIIRKVLQCEAWSVSGGDHCWFKRSTGKKCLWQETSISYSTTTTTTTTITTTTNNNNVLAIINYYIMYYYYYIIIIIIMYFFLNQTILTAFEFRYLRIILIPLDIFVPELRTAMLDKP